MKRRNIYVVGGDYLYANWMQGEIVNKMHEADLVVFTGGEDVDPALYGRKPHSTTSFNRYRDDKEVGEFDLAKSYNLPMVGICRGSQFLCAMAGGILVQHQSHLFRHSVQVQGGDDILVTSTHHQRQFPFVLPSSDWGLLGWCNLSPFSFGEENEDMTRWSNGFTAQERDLPEVEAAYYCKINALAIQSHPEIVYPASGKADTQFIAQCRKWLDDLMDGRLGGP